VFVSQAGVVRNDSLVGNALGNEEDADFGVSLKALKILGAGNGKGDALFNRGRGSFFPCGFSSTMRRLILNLKIFSTY